MQRLIFLLMLTSLALGLPGVGMSPALAADAVLERQETVDLSQQGELHVKQMLRDDVNSLVTA